MIDINNRTVLYGIEWMDLITDELKEDINKNSFKVIDRGNFSDFIDKLFNWRASYQGDFYWRNIYNRRDISEYLKVDVVRFTELEIDPKKIIESYY